MRGCKTIAEYAIKKWMHDNGFVMSEFSVNISGNNGIITDKVGDILMVEYDRETKSVKTNE